MEPRRSPLILLGNMSLLIGVYRPLAEGLGVEDMGKLKRRTGEEAEGSLGGGNDR